MARASPFRPLSPGLRRRPRLLLGVGAAGLLGVVPLLVRRITAVPASAGLDLHPRPRELPELRFVDAKGAPTSLAAFRGRMVLLNVWATWCTPCREEMPALDRLQALLGGPGFAVLTLSIDRDGKPAVRAFFVQTQLEHLQPYLDTPGEVLARLGVAGIPLTLLIDRDGREIGRKLGPAAWDRAPMVELIRGQFVSAAARAESLGS